MRWWIVALVSLGTIVNYLSRNTLGILAPVLKTDLGLTTEQYSYVVGAFQAAYTVMQPVCGFILDNLGLKTGFALFALLWSAASCAHVFAGGWLSLAAFRGWLGLTEAAAIPAGVKAIAEWFPAKERSVGMGLFNIGTSIGAMLAPPMVAFLEIHYGWRSAFLATGAMGFAFAILWRSVYRSPAKAADAVKPPRPALLPILRSRAFWGLGLPRFLFEPAWQTFIFWVPLYFATARGMDIREIGMFAWLPFLAADLGSLVGGFISPFLMTYLGFGLVSSRLAGVVMGALIMIAPGCVGLAPSAMVAVALLCVGGFAHQIISGLINTLATDKFGAHEVATASGLAGMAGWLGGLAFSLIVGQLVDQVGYTPVFASLSLFDLCGAAIAVLLLREPRTPPMRLDHPPLFALTKSDGNHLTLRSAEGHVAHIFVLEEDILRVMVLPKGEMRGPKSWAICPGGEDVPPEGRDRFDLSGFFLPAFLTHQTESELIVTTKQIRLTIRLAGFFCRWEMLRESGWQAAAMDRPTQAYNFGWWDQGVHHYLARSADEMYFGLGEKAGPANRAGQSYRMTNLDAMGYDARSTDPLYKHTPFYITWKQKDALPFGLFYDTLADCRFDMGRELDNYHGPYRSFRAEAGDLDLYFIAGATPAEVTRRFTWLTGRPAMMPKWSLGYSGSTMSYTDAPDAQAQMNKFLEKCREHDILCDSFHLSSGYTSIGPKRYVFHWNRVKFPDPTAFARHYREHGVRLCANIKPCLLRDHPRYEEAARAGLFIKDADGMPVPAQFWDETGAYLDFTNPKTRAWWRERVTESLLETGIEATWNDNNEFEIWDERAVLDAGGRAIDSRPLHTLLMIQASKQAQTAFAPDRRPFLISRAGAVGMQRYVQSWSGDNYTSWDTLKFNIRMGTGMAMSGLSNTGHDIGGFAGPAPDAELLLRWVQFGIFLPRFSIHSWNDDKTVNEPWMYPEITGTIAELIKLRARLTPYLYDLLWRSHSAYEPMIRPTYYDFPEDPTCFAETDEMMLGAHLLVAAVVEPGQNERRVTLPKGTGWYDFWRGTRFEGGQTVSVTAELDARTPLFVREGSAIPLNLAEQHFNKPADQRGFAIFAGEGGFEASCYEDDGETNKGRHDFWRLRVSADAKTLKVAVEKPEGTDRLTLLLPATEKRAVSLEGARLAGAETTWEGWRRLDLTL